MKKILCLLMAVTAITACFAGCTDGKCDTCETKDGVKVYTVADQKEKKEFCTKCAARYMADNLVVLKPVED